MANNKPPDWIVDVGTCDAVFSGYRRKTHKARRGTRFTPPVIPTRDINNIILGDNTSASFDRQMACSNAA
jgi:hypothetical protein